MTELQSILESLPEHGSVNRSATFFQWAWKHFCKFFKPRFNLHFQIYRYNLHVIYLARDPRGILNSVRALPSQWPTRLLSPLHICSRYSPSPDLYVYRHVIFKSNVFLRLLNDSVHISTHNLTKVLSFEIDQIKDGAVVTMISTDNDPQIWRLGESAFWRTCSDRGKVQHLPDQ